MQDFVSKLIIFLIEGCGLGLALFEVGRMYCKKGEVHGKKGETLLP